MSARARLAAVVLAAVLVVVPIVFAEIDGTTGALIGLAFSGVSGIVALCLWTALTIINRRFDKVERRLAAPAAPKQQAQAQAQRQRQQQPVEVKLPKGIATVAHLRKERDHHAKRTQDIVNLFSMVPIRSGIPPLGLWTASADLLVELVDRLVEGRPAVAIEGGSGVSTVVMALAVREHGLPTRVIALEHNPEWGAHTRRMLERHGVADHAEVRIAPLGPTSLADHSTPWYDESALADLTDIGLVLVDGPPEGTGPRARYPMIPLLRDKLAHRCTILVDDTAREGDADVVERWRPFLPDFEFEKLHLDKGAAVLTRK
ncbi:MAG TPA: class I SAM-dependent methyltransferase [Nocardioides sp.]|nr:class I SAM-dependent methyltransferase [Nocardioides sp.]